MAPPALSINGLQLIRFELDMSFSNNVTNMIGIVRNEAAMQGASHVKSRALRTCGANTPRLESLSRLSGGERSDETSHLERSDLGARFGSRGDERGMR
jgi:hypothetical protein